MLISFFSFLIFSSVSHWFDVFPSTVVSTYPVCMSVFIRLVVSCLHVQSPVQLVTRATHRDNNSFSESTLNILPHSSCCSVNLSWVRVRTSDCSGMLSGCFPRLITQQQSPLIVRASHAFGIFKYPRARSHVNGAGRGRRGRDYAAGPWICFWSCVQPVTCRVTAAGWGFISSGGSAWLIEGRRHSAFKHRHKTYCEAFWRRCRVNIL